jgi:hypothetical protein
MPRFWTVLWWRGCIMDRLRISLRCLWHQSLQSPHVLLSIHNLHDLPKYAATFSFSSHWYCRSVSTCWNVHFCLQPEAALDEGLRCSSPNYNGRTWYIRLPLHKFHYSHTNKQSESLTALSSNSEISEQTRSCAKILSGDQPCQCFGDFLRFQHQGRTSRWTLNTVNPRFNGIIGANGCPLDRKPVKLRIL